MPKTYPLGRAPSTPSEALDDAHNALEAISSLIAGRREPPDLTHDDTQGLAVIFDAIQRTIGEVADDYRELEAENRRLREAHPSKGEA